MLNIEAENDIMTPIAKVRGEDVVVLPKDLYIPPDALEVFLEAFEGPLDLLLYFIKRQNMDILDISVAKITQQYMEYIDLMSTMRLTLAAEYLVMASMLAEIKSRMLLPRPEEEEGEESDPRAELIRRLQDYERFKQAAEDLRALPQQGRDTFQSHAKMPPIEREKPEPEVDLKELLLAFQDIMRRAELNNSHQIQQEPLSIRERMSHILAKVQEAEFIDFASLFTVNEGRMGVVVTFIALLELLKSHLVDMVQADMFGPIHIKVVGE